MAKKMDKNASKNASENFSGRWFCIGTSGPTADGRNINAEDLIAAAESYDPQIYGARINLEHYRPYSPKNDYSGLGDVLELKAETKGGITRLFARIDPTEKMAQYIKDREKVYTSMELMKPFAGTGKAYLVGLAMTDSPASLGTTMLKFRQLHPDDPNYTSKYQAMETENAMQTDKTAQTAPENEKKGFFAALFEKMSAKKEEEGAPATAPETEGYAARLDAAESEIENAAKVAAKLADEYTALRQEFDAFKRAVESAPVNAAAPHTGANTAAVSDF